VSVICLFFPRLALDLVRRRSETLRLLPLIVVEGHGEDARVLHRSPDAACLGVLVGMRAGQARRLAPRAAFVPFPRMAAGEELERMAALLRDETALHVSAVREDHLLFEAADGAVLSRGLDSYVERLAEALSLRTGHLVTGGVASSPEAAVANARLAARRPQRVSSAA
jgi:hypothetical protein